RNHGQVNGSVIFHMRSGSRILIDNHSRLSVCLINGIDLVAKAALFQLPHRFGDRLILELWNFDLLAMTCIAAKRKEYKGDKYGDSDDGHDEVVSKRLSTQVLKKFIHVCFLTDFVCFSNN